jgi:arylsulfatase A
MLRAMKVTLMVSAMALLLSSAIIPAAESPGPPPNIVVLLLDNVGQEWFHCYGSEENCTPNIDRLAAAGVRFSHCYTTTVCGPQSRGIADGALSTADGMVFAS